MSAKSRFVYQQLILQLSDPQSSQTVCRGFLLQLDLQGCCSGAFSLQLQTLEMLHSKT